MSIYGTFSYHEKSYPFVLDNRIVKVIGEPLQYKNDFEDINEVETIRGVTSDNRDILFLHCAFIKQHFGVSTSFSIHGYALSKNNTGEPREFTYDRSSFASDAINTFFTPQKAIKIDMDMKNWNGGIDIHVMPFNETTVTFEYLNAQCELSISRYIRVAKEPTSIGKVSSIFSFEYHETQSILSIIDDYLALYDFLTFANYNANISFDEIHISQRNEKGRYENTAVVHIFSNKSKYEGLSNTSVTIDDIPTDKLGDIFVRIASLRKTDSRLHYYFPENEHEARYIDPGKWLIAALNFEGLFSTIYPHFKCNQNAEFANAKQMILDRVDCTSDGKTLTKKEQKYYNKCREQILYYEGQLEEKFNYVFANNQDILRKILQYNEGQLRVSCSANYGSIYSAYRNKIAHGSVVPLTNEEIAVYKLLMPMVYILLLNDVGLSAKELSQIINKLFE